MEGIPLLPDYACLVHRHNGSLIFAGRLIQHCIFDRTSIDYHCSDRTHSQHRLPHANDPRLSNNRTAHDPEITFSRTRRQPNEKRPRHPNIQVQPCIFYHAKHVYHWHQLDPYFCGWYIYALIRDINCVIFHIYTKIFRFYGIIC